MPDQLSQSTQAARAADPDHTEIETGQVEVARVPVLEEQIVVDKQVETTGHVRLHKVVDSESVVLDLEHKHEGFEVERRAVGTLSETRPPATRREGEATIYSIVREVPVITTQYELVEEVILRPKHSVEQETRTVERRTERVEIERSPKS